MATPQTLYRVFGNSTKTSEYYVSVKWNVNHHINRGSISVRLLFVCEFYFTMN